MELKDTIDGMTSADYKDRFIAEYKQLCIRLDKLLDIIDKESNSKLEFELKSSKSLLLNQARTMIRYKGILEDRAANEGINLD